MNFARVLADFRAVQAEDRPKRKAQMTEAAAEFAADFLIDLGNGDEQALAALFDHMSGIGPGADAFRDMVQAVIEEEPAKARAALDRAVEAVAIYEIDVRGDY